MYLKIVFESNFQLYETILKSNMLMTSIPYTYKSQYYILDRLFFRFTGMQSPGLNYKIY